MKYPIAILLLLLSATCKQKNDSHAPTFSISFAKGVSDQAQDGRLLLMLSKNDKSEPRNQINDGLGTQLIFGVDVENMSPDTKITVGADAFGFPIRKLSDIPKGEYFVQAVLNRYETFKLKTGHSVKLPPDQGEGQQWNSKPGNFFSKPIKISFDPSSSEEITLVMDQKIPPITPPQDTKYVKHSHSKCVAF